MGALGLFGMFGLLGRPRAGVSAGLFAISASLSLPSYAAPGLATPAAKSRVAAATVTLLDKGCAGVIAGSSERVLTAAHCVPQGARSLRVRLRDRTQLEGSVVYLDRVRDLAILELTSPTAIPPLTLASELPKAGDRVLFVGRIDRRSRVQVATVERLGSCPSLPGVNDAVFTNLRARPGDSGAPLVNEALAVVGVVQGGATCEIVAPSASIAELVNAPAKIEQPAELEDDAGGAATVPEGAARGAAPVRRYQAGPFVFERIPGGFRFRFSFDWRTESGS